MSDSHLCLTSQNTFYKMSITSPYITDFNDSAGYLCNDNDTVIFPEFTQLSPLLQVHCNTDVSDFKDLITPLSRCYKIWC